MASEFKIKNGLIVVGDVSTSGTITINGALAATQSWVTSQAYLTSSSLTSYATQTYVNNAVAALVDSAPGALDTLRELATALGNDASFSTTVTNSIAAKLPLAGGTLTGALLMGNGVAAAANSQPTALSYGLLQAYGTFTLAADTDGTQSEFAIITAGYGVASASAANGLAIGFNTLTWKNNTVWHAGNLTNLNQLTNGPGYLTSYTETDTLASVTARGATTSQNITINGQLVLNNGVANGSAQALIVGGSGDVTLSDGGSLFFGAYDYGGSTYIRGYDNGNVLYFYVNGSNIAYLQNDRLYLAGTIFTSSHGNSSQWNTAYSWGNHASGGYQAAATAITTSNIASQSVSYANSAGSAGSAGYVTSQSGQLYGYDNRIISPSETTANYLQFGFTSWANDNSAPYADYLHLRSYPDSSGGSDNLVMFLKSGIGMRIYQQTFGSGSAYSSYADVWHSGNLTNLNQLSNGPGYITASALSPYLPLAGGTMSGILTFSSAYNAYIYTFSRVGLANQGRIIYNNGTGSNMFFGELASNIYGFTSNAYTDTPALSFNLSTNNVGIGTSSPGTNKLHVFNGSSGGTAYNSGGLVVESSSRASIQLLAPNNQDSYLFFGDANSGTGGYIGHYGTSMSPADLMVYYSEGNHNFTNGNVGIGTSTPGYKLDIQGIVSVGTTAVGGTLRLEGKGGFSYPAQISTATVSGIKFSDDSGGMNVVFLSSGNVGIGTTAPATSLEVQGAANTLIQAIFQSSSVGNAAYNGGIQLGNAASNQKSSIVHDSSGDNTLTFTSHYSSGSGNKFIFAPGGTETVRFQQNGNVGIGTTDPTSQMSGTFGIGIYNASYPAVGFKNSTTAWLWYGQNSTFKMWNVTAGDILTANTSGNIGIGTTSPGYKLDINGNSRTTGIHYVDTYLVTPYIYGGGPITMGNDVTITSATAWNASAARLNVGGTGDGRIQVRHIYGKSAESAAADHLWLQYQNTGNHVQIGAGSEGNNLYVSGNIYMNGYFGGNLVATQSWVNSQGFLTSYSETDTLASVTGRGESTTGRINVRGPGNQSGGNIMMGNTGEGVSKWSYLTGTHYNASSQPQGFALIGGLATSGGNAVVIGGNIYETNPATEIQFWTHGTNTHNLGGTQRGVINSSGNWGIGTNTPSKLLEVAGDIMAGTSNKIGFRYSGGDSNFYNYITADNANPLTLVGGMWTASGATEGIRFATYNGAALSILNNGNVGIGTTAPAIPRGSGFRPMLHVYNNSAGTNPAIVVSAEDSQMAGYIAGDNAGGSDIGWGWNAYYQGNGNNFYNIRIGDNGTWTDRFTIDRYGKVGIGTTSPSENLHVLGRGIFDGGSGNSSTDAVLYVTKSTNDDWGLYVNNVGLDYGIYARMSPSANYAFAIHNGTTWTTRITGNAVIYLGEKNAIEGNSDSWLRLNNSSQYASGVYTPGVMRADGGFNVSGSTVWHAGNDGSGSGLDADLLDGQNSTEFLRLLSGGAEASLDSYTDNGIRSVNFTGHSQHLLSWNAGGSTGTVQQLFHYGTPNNGWRIRNKTDNTSWSDWGYVVMASSNQGLISGTIATQSWVGSQSYATTSYVTTQINNLINGAPGALDTLNELATALGNDASFSTTVTNSIAGKVSKAGDTMTSSGQQVLNIFHGAATGDFNDALFVKNTVSAQQVQIGMATTGSDGDHHRVSLRAYKGAQALEGVFGIALRQPGSAAHTQRLTLDYLGNLTIGGFLTESSSFKLKENVETSEGNLEKVVNLRPVTYNKIGSQTTELGLIAEEVAEVYPEFVQYDESGEPVGVNYSRLTAALIGAVKELTNQVQELNKKING
jgi:hypothetical protein